MKASLIALISVLAAEVAVAHRLDEYLQATRIAVSAARIEATFDLTPGVSIASQLLAVIDADADGNLSAAEGTKYAHRFLKDLTIHLDGRSVELELAGIDLPSVRELRRGMGIIRLKAFLPVESRSPGRHELRLRNDHLPAISVHLVNALVPKDRWITIGRQTRDTTQQEYRLEFERGPEKPADGREVPVAGER
jgi:hypothetical protein